MGDVVNAVPRFARRTAEACVNLWERERTIEMMKKMGRRYEKEVVKQIEQMQIEMLQKEEEGD